MTIRTATCAMPLCFAALACGQSPEQQDAGAQPSDASSDASTDASMTAPDAASLATAYPLLPTVDLRSRYDSDRVIDCPPGAEGEPVTAPTAFFGAYSALAIGNELWLGYSGDVPAGNGANGSILYVLSRDADKQSLSAVVGEPWEPSCTHMIRDDGIRQMTQVGDHVYIAGNDMRWGLRGYDWLYKIRHSDKTLAARMQIGGGTTCGDDVPEECTDHLWGFLSDGSDLFVVGSSWFANIWRSADAGQSWGLDASWASGGGGMARAYDIAKLGDERAVLVTMYDPAYPQIYESALHFAGSGAYGSRPELSGLEPMPKKRLVSHDGAIVYPDRNTSQLVAVHATAPAETWPLPFALPEEAHNWGASADGDLYVVSAANEIWRLGPGGFELFANVPASHPLLSITYWPSFGELIVTELETGTIWAVPLL